MMDELGLGMNEKIHKIAVIAEKLPKLNWRARQKKELCERRTFEPDK